MQIGTIVEERYRIESELGGGAMGRVYRARHVRLGREVAVKVLREDLMAEPAIVERFAREARVAARLRHPNLVSLLDVGEHLMVMELAPGRPLADLTGAPMPRARVIAIVSQLLRGLAHAHAAGLVHRDLKPDNVLVDADGIVRIVDFGIAVVRDRSDERDHRRLTAAGLVVGTPIYMAPEQAKGRRVDHRADLFSLGVITYELLAGVPPFEGNGAEVALANVTQDPPLIADRVRGVDVDPLLEAFAHTLMARRLDDRFASAHDALTTLELIDRDRDAAARALGVCGGPLEPPPATRRLARTSDAPPLEPDALPRDSDALATLRMAATERIVRRRPARWPLAAAAVLVLLAGWAALSPAAPVASAAALPAATSSEPALHVAPAIARVEAPPAAVATAPTRHAVAIETVDSEPAVQPVVVEDHSALALVARYREIGRLLETEHASGDVWELYRRIRLHDAMATAAARDRAFEALAEIERTVTKE